MSRIACLIAGMVGCRGGPATLILHSEREMVAPLAEARYMAARIPGARFVPLDSANHLVMQQEPAWQRAVDEIRKFLTA